MLLDGPSARQKAPVRALQGLGLAFGRGRRATSQAARLLLPLLCGTSKHFRALAFPLAWLLLADGSVARSLTLARSFAGWPASWLAACSGVQWSPSLSVRCWSESTAAAFASRASTVVANPRHDEGQRLFNILHTHSHTHIHENTQGSGCMIASASLKLLRRPSSSAVACSSSSLSSSLKQQPAKLHQCVSYFD